ncbi:MAG TPA: rhomboid family intramembrane serine protease [Bacteroidia bacterium]|nr:rhomboid family intramembrane serine protease [Bacteroidia bacterium]
MDSTSPDFYHSQFENSVGPQYKNSFSKWRLFPWMTISILLFTCLIYFLTAALDGNVLQLSVGTLVNCGGNFSGLTLNNEWWRLLTSVFLHVNLVHLLFNMYALFSIGVLLEPVTGHWRFLAYYIVLGVGASITSLMWSTFIVSVGASGAIFGLFGFYLIYLLAGKRKMNKFNPVSTSIIISIGINLLIGGISTFIDNAAHIGGLITGFLCGGVWMLFLKKEKPGHKKRSNYACSISLISTLFIYTILYVTISKDRAVYFSFFQQFLKTEREALQMENNMFSDPSFRTQLDAVYKLWHNLKGGLDSLDQAHNNTAVEDRALLYTYLTLREQSISDLRKMVDSASFLYLDSFHQVNSKIESLPPIRYALNFYPSEIEKDSLDDRSVMYDKNWLVTTNKDEMVYSRKSKVDKLGRTQGWVYDFYPNHVLQMKAFYYNNLIDGITFYFYPNGHYKSVGMVNKEMKTGKWQNFYSNGQLQSEIVYYPGHIPEVRTFYDSTGLQFVSEGNGYVKYLDEEDQLIEEGAFKNQLKDGVWLGYYTDGSPCYKEIFKDGRLVKGNSTSLNGEEYFYETTVEFPKPRIGWDRYQQYIDSSITAGGTYASRGQVSIELYIDSLGQIKSMKPVLIIGSGCEDTLMSIINRNPDFIPGKVKGMIKGMRTYVYGQF